MSGLLIYNASAGPTARTTPGQLLSVLPAGTQLHEFADGDDPAVLAQEALAAGVSWIAVAGGDGTVEAVAAKLVDSGVPLGVIPCGTYNNFARSAELPMDPLAAARLITGGVTRAIDVGFVNERPFFECVGVGLDAALFPLGEEIKSGGFAKWLDLLRRARDYPRQLFTLQLDRPLCEALASKHWRDRLRRHSRRTLRLRALMVTVSNGPYYGMNFTVAPDARIDSGEFTVSIFKRYRKLELAWHFFSIRAGRRAYAPKLVALKVRQIEISGPDKLHVHADGAPLDQWPLTLKIKPGALRIYSASKSEEMLQK